MIPGCADAIAAFDWKGKLPIPRIRQQDVTSIRAAGTQKNGVNMRNLRHAQLKMIPARNILWPAILPRISRCGVLLLKRQPNRFPVRRNFHYLHHVEESYFVF
jgi:hypothetical protein